MMLLVTIALGGLLIYLVHYLLLGMKNNYWKDRGVPSLPVGSPLFGNMSAIIYRTASMGEIITSLYKALEGHKFGGFFMFQSPVLMIRDPEMINNFLIKDFASFQDRNLPSMEEFDLMSASMANMTGERWRLLRYKLTPTFTSGKLKRMFDQIRICSDEIADHIATLAEGEPVDIRDISFKFTINVIGLVAFGLKIDSHKAAEGRSKIFIEMSKRLFRPSKIQFLKFFIRMSYPKLMETLGVKMNDEEMDTFFKTLVSDTIKHRLETGTRRDDFLQLMMDLRSGTKKHQSASENDLEAEDDVLMDQLKNVSQGKSNKDIELTDHLLTAQTFLFIAGGSETTAAVLHFALFELANNQEVQEKVQNEIDSVLKNREFDYQAVKEMTYLENVMNETLRLHPPGSILARFCTETYQIPGTDIVLEKGTQIQIPVIGIHKDPKYFENPEQFDPDRFNREMPKGVFFPFGAGPRICIAMRLAMLQLKILVARLMTKYTVTLSSKTQLPLKLRPDSIVQHVQGGIWLHFEQRINKTAISSV